MKLVAVIEDGIVCIDDECRNVDFTSIDKNIRAIQWNGEKGHIEYFDSSPNKIISSIDCFSELIKEWEESKKIQEQINEKSKSYLQFIKNNEEQYPIAESSLVFELISTPLRNLRVEPRIRQSDKHIIGVDISWLWGAEDRTGTIGLFSLKSLIKKSIEKGIPVITTSRPTVRNFEQFSRLMASFGFSVYEEDEELYLYVPWSLELAKNRRKKIIDKSCDMDNRFLSSRLLSYEDFNKMQYELYVENFLNYQKVLERKQAVDKARTFEEIEKC